MGRRHFILLLLLAITLIWNGCGGSDSILPPSSGDSATSGLNTLPTQPGKDFVDLSSRLSDPSTDIRDLPRYIDGEVLIVLQDNINPDTLHPMANKLGLSLMKEIRLTWGMVYRMSITDGTPVETMVETLLAYPEIRYAEPNFMLYSCAAPYYPNDPLFEYPGDPDNDPWNYKYDQWGPNVLGASLVWPELKGSEDVVVCVLDTGYRYTHEDLENQIWINEDEIVGNNIDDDDNGYIDDWRGWDTDDDDNDPWDTYGHGTACSGVVAAEQDNGVGCTGIAPGVKIMAIRCDLGGGGGYTSSVIEGIQYAYDNGADIVSMSFRTYDDSQIMHNTFITAYDDGNGLLPVGGAGNENSNDTTYPACWPEVVEVGGTCSFYAESGARRDVQRIQPDEYGWGSNFGTNLEVMAPGSQYVATHVGNDSSYYDGGSNGTFGGTSCSTPCAAACFALLKSAFPAMTALELRERLNETCDDLYGPGHDTQSGWGRINIWRAIFGSEPNEDLYDVNNHIPLILDDPWFYDGLFDVPDSDDYDREDIFAFESPIDGVVLIDMDIITTGENLDIALYDSPDLTTPIATATGTNGEANPWESIVTDVQAGQTYYLKVYSPDAYNCSNYRVVATVEKKGWWVEYESIGPSFAGQGSDCLPLLELEIHTNLPISFDTLRVYFTGDTPLSIVNHVWLYEDINDSGDFEKYIDDIVGSVDPVTNQTVFNNLGATVTHLNSARYFVVADVGPYYVEKDIYIGIGLKSYKDIGVYEDVPMAENNFPIFSDYTILGQDHDPPYWEGTIGIQDVTPQYQSALVYWNHASDLLSEPCTYNVYWDDDSPPEIDPAKMVENVSTWSGGDYDFKAPVGGLENDQTYSFCVRAVDAADNEEDNEVWLEGTPEGSSDPYNPIVIGEIELDNDAWEVWAHDQIAYVANGYGGMAIVDCTVPTMPVFVDNYPTNGCYSVQYYDEQDYVYATSNGGLLIIDPHNPGGPSLIGSYTTSNCMDLVVADDICYMGNYYGDLYVIDVSTPSDPQLLGQVDLGWYGILYGVAERDGYVFCCTYYYGLRIVNATNPASPYIAKTLSLAGDTYEISLYGDYALVTTWDNQRLSVINIADPPTSFLEDDFFISGGSPAGVAARDDEFVYVGVMDDELWSISWNDFDNIQKAGSVLTDGPNGLFYDGVYLYAAENEDGLKVLL